MRLVSGLISKVKGGISKAKIVYYATHIDKYFSKEQIAEGIKVFWQTWDGNIVRSAKRFVEIAKANPKLVKAEGEVNVGLLLALFIFILIGIVLLPVITSEVTSLTSGTSPQVTGTNLFADLTMLPSHVCKKTLMPSAICSLLKYLSICVA